ncbi:MAG: 2-C-methyl-D-erythritol 2,4-cyclodiphosphate synthase, partial [Armatimonadetes bacterium]|nr:2-C-methyl-D-erythritol 2,4-cyclodiphosphate synthase [Candidatus Hippobium faecium]
LLFSVKGKTILEHTVSAFDKVLCINEIVIVTDSEDIKSLFRNRKDGKIIFAPGGKTRQESVRNGLDTVKGDCVLIHDGARPLVSEKIIINCIEELKREKALVVCVPATDTVKKSKHGYVSETPDRKDIYLAQTPQGFRTELIRELHEQAEKDRINVTDDASVCEHYNIPVKIIEGEYRNIKVTTQNDISLLKTYFRENTMRIGYGYDVHRLEKDRKLILGGIEIPYEYGLLGHSDADVLLHAITDAVLGACSLGDLGKHFPPSDNKYKNIDSMILLKKAVKMAEEKNYIISNIDATVVAQKPKLAPYIEDMKQKIALSLQIDPELVSIKATTTEHLGFEGREEGISAASTVLMEKI